MILWRVRCFSIGKNYVFLNTGGFWKGAGACLQNVTGKPKNMTVRLAIILTIFLFGCGQSRLDNFDRIIFHSGPCYSECPILHLELNNDKSIRLFSESLYLPTLRFRSKEDTSRIGYFIGQAKDSTFKKLLSELRRVSFDEESFSGPMYTCGAEITIVYYSKGKRRFFHSLWPSEDARPLIQTFYEILKTSDLKRTEETFKIDDGRASR